MQAVLEGLLKAEELLEPQVLEAAVPQGRLEV